MKFVNDFPTGQKVILERFPEFRGAFLSGDDSGWDNFAIYVDRKYIFRFPRREDALEQIKQEVEVLSSVRPRLQENLQVPHYLASELCKDYPFVYYKMIEGEPLTLESYQRFSKSDKDQLAQNIATFLNTLHETDLTDCQSLKKINAKANYEDFYRQITEVCFKYLDSQEQTKSELLFANYFKHPEWQEFKPTVVHGDLSENHILLSNGGIGVIDFGDTSIFDPAIDLSWFYLFDKDLFYNVLSRYSAHKDNHFEQRISEFYAPIIPYYGIIFGEETDNQQLVQEELADLKENLGKNYHVDH